MRLPLDRPRVRKRGTYQSWSGINVAEKFRELSGAYFGRKSGGRLTPDVAKEISTTFGVSEIQRCNVGITFLGVDLMKGEGELIYIKIFESLYSRDNP